MNPALKVTAKGASLVSNHKWFRCLGLWWLSTTPNIIIVLCGVKIHPGTCLRRRRWTKGRILSTRQSYRYTGSRETGSRVTDVRVVLSPERESSTLWSKVPREGVEEEVYLRSHQRDCTLRLVQTGVTLRRGIQTGVSLTPQECRGDGLAAPRTDGTTVVEDGESERLSQGGCDRKNKKL